MAEAKAEAGAPLAPAEIDRLFTPVLAGRKPESLALAVSGGSDSTALMVLFAEWLATRGHSPSACTVLTVDHRLRPESADEAAAVARQASALGYRHATLVWDGDKPKAGVQAAARAARYGLMAAYARAHGIVGILTAHTADDQAETLLMRLARGSGLDGLSAMSPVGVLHEDVGAAHADRIEILRPLLETPKERLIASLRQRGVAWMEDPSNVSIAFERPRVRAARAMLDSLGLTSSMLGLSARRLQRVRDALDAWVMDVLHPARGIVVVHPCGIYRIDIVRLRELPPEIVARVLTRAVAAAGGADDPVPLAGIEAIMLQLLSPHDAPDGAWTLARAKLTTTADTLLIEREPGRDALPRLVLAPGEAALWDGRFRVAVGAGFPHVVDVGALGVDGVRTVRAHMVAPDDLPVGVTVGALRALPAFWSGERLLAVPPLAFWADADARRQLHASFIAINGAAGLTRNLYVP